MQNNLLLFRSLINQSNDAISVIDPETGFFLHVNDKMCSNLGYDYRELLNMRVADVDAVAIPDDFAWKEHVNKVRRKGYMLLEGAHKRKDGTTFPVEVNVKYLEIDNKAYLVGVARDITERRLSEDALRKSEKQLRDVTSYLSEGIYVLNQEGNIIFMNPTAEQLVGWTMAELKNKNAHNVLHYRKADGTPLPFEECPMHNVIKTGKLLSSTDEIFIRKDGTVLPVSVISSPIIENGKAVASVAAFRDITEHKQMEKERERLIFELGVANEELEQEIAERRRAEDALRENEKFLQTIIETEPDCIKLLAADGTLLQMNRAGLSMIEADSLSQVKGQCVYQLVVPEYREAFKSLTADVFKGRPGVLEFEAVGLRGTHIWLETHAVPLRNDSDEIIALLGITRDVTEHKKAEDEIRNLNKELERRVIERTAQLKESAQRFQLAAESGQLGVWDWNVQSNFMVWNDRMFELYGISRDAFTNSVEAWRNSLHPDDCNKAMADGDAALRGEKEFDTEFRVLHPDGTVKVLKANAIVIRDADGKPVRMLGLNRDITELREAEEKLIRSYSDLEIKVQERTAELTAAKHQLEELNLTLEQRVLEEIASRHEKEQLLFQQSRMAAMGEMIGAIAHQWRQPLNVIGLIIQNLQMAYEYGELDKMRLKNAVATAMWQVNFMSKTIDDFRNFFKPSREKELFDVKKIVDETISLMKAQLQNSFIDIEIITKKEGLVMKGYPNEFKHVLLNLINNAKDAILVRKAHEDCQTKITILLSEKADKVIIKVRDTGGGVPGHIMDKIFDPYFTTKDEGTGTGIGLYISKTMVERNMGGRLTARNWKEGAEFRIEV